MKARLTVLFPTGTKGSELNGTELSWVGQKFSDDDDLGAEHPDLTLSSVISAYESGKTDWEEQHVRAAELIVRDLIGQKIIYSKNQILERETFMLPSVSKVAEIIYSAFGDDYSDQKAAARGEYKERFSKSIYDVDLNEDGDLSLKEMSFRQGFMKR